MKILTYFDWLRLTAREDTENNFILYLIKVLQYKEEDAKKEASIYYKEY